MIFSIRSRVLLLSLTLFSIPYVGYEYVREMEQYLRRNLETSLQETARAVAGVLNSNPTLFSRKLVDTVPEDEPLFAHTLKDPIKFDGNIDDWGDLLLQTGDYAGKHILKNSGTYSQDSLSFRHVLSKYKGYLYALFVVQDDILVYREPTSLRLDRSDHLQIVMKEPNGQIYRYVITPSGPGWINAYKVPSHSDSPKAEVENRIQGLWQQTADGYIIELRVPLNKINERLGFAIADVDDLKERNIKTLIGTSAIQNLETVGKVFIPSPEIENIIKPLAQTPGRRLWVLDNQRRVLAKSGDLQREFLHHPLNVLYSFLLLSSSENFKDDQARASRLEGEEVNSALKGQAELRWSSTSDEQAVIVSAAHPIVVDNQVIGAVVAQETTSSIQAVQRQAIANLFNKTLIVFTVVTLLLLWFANRLSIRLRQLRDQAEHAIDLNGRVTTTKIGSTAKDEIGDLSRSFSTILEKLKQYNTYLEGMASRLSHELRTPLAVVRSSLENLESLETFQVTGEPKESQIYIERAKAGIDRLNMIITRLSEATRLEQALQNEERELFELTELVSSCVAGYRLVYPQQNFQAELSGQPILLQGVPDLIAQMLDKLISNAVDFSEGQSPIKIQLYQERQMIHLEVINRGKSLPLEIEQDQLFESMVSFRSQSGKKEPHLGLGLYIVRLIAGYHGGQVRANNNHEYPGAIFSVLLPVTDHPALLLSAQ